MRGWHRNGRLVAGAACLTRAEPLIAGSSAGEP